jgi:hypothetical protein
MSCTIDTIKALKERNNDESRFFFLLPIVIFIVDYVVDSFRRAARSNKVNKLNFSMEKTKKIRSDKTTNRNIDNMNRLQ